MPKVVDELGRVQQVFFKGGGGSSGMEMTDARNADFYDNVVKPSIGRTMALSQGNPPGYSLRLPGKYDLAFNSLDQFGDFSVLSTFTSDRETLGTVLRSLPLYSRVIELYDQWRQTESPNNAHIDEAVDAHEEKMREKVEQETIPRFEVGMRDVGAVLSFGYILGRAIIWKGHDNSVSEFDANLRTAAYEGYKGRLQDMAKTMASSLNALYAQFEIEQNKAALQIVLAKLEQKKIVTAMRHNLINDENTMYQKYDANYTAIMHDQKMWPYEPLQALAQVHASIHGGGGAPGQQKPNAAASAISGALSGAAVGFQIGGGPGAALGAAVGGIGGLLSAQ